MEKAQINFEALKKGNQWIDKVDALQNKLWVNLSQPVFIENIITGTPQISQGAKIAIAQVKKLGLSGKFTRPRNTQNVMAFEYE